jgi:hypothetical protein
VTKKNKAQRGNLLDIQPGKPTVKKSAKESYDDQIKRRARQADHFHEWRERKQLELLGYDDLD